jgi:Arc/MetJ-type ribon-helix-helix transcriptional regulator
MARLVRKNLIVDADELRLLAEQRGTSESEAVREAVRMALGTQEMVEALQALHDLGAFEDFEQLYGESPSPRPDDADTRT